MKEQQRGLSNRPAALSTSRPEQLGVAAQPVDQYVAPKQSQRLNQFADALGRLVPQLSAYHKERVDQAILEENALGEYDAATGANAPGSENSHRVAAFGKARAISGGIEYAQQLRNEVADKYSVDDPAIWDKYGNPADAVSAHFHDRAKQAVAGMSPATAPLFLHSIEKERLSAVAEKQKQIADKVHTDKVHDISTMMADDLVTYGQSGQVTAETSRDLYSRHLQHATHDLGLDRKTASAALAEQFSAYAIENKQPELLDFMHTKDKDGIALAQTEVGKGLTKARADAQKAKDAELSMTFIQDFAAYKTKVDNGEFTQADAQELINKYPQKVAGDDKQIAGMLSSSIHNRAELAKKSLIEEALSPEHYKQVALAEEELKQAIARGDGSAEQLLPLLQQQFPEEFKNRKVGKALAESELAQTTKQEFHKQAVSVNLSQIPDGDDKNKFIAERFDNIAKQGKQAGWTDDQIQEMQIADLNGSRYKPLEDKLNNGLRSVPVDINAPATPEFLNGVKLYEQMYKINQARAEASVDPDVRDDLHTYLNARDSGGKSDADAWAVVQQTRNTPAHIGKLHYSPPSNKVIERGIRNITDWEDISNQGQMIEVLKNYTAYYISKGALPDKAAEVAAARINGEYVTLNGTKSWAGKLTVPSDAEDFLDDYLQKHYSGKDGSINKDVFEVHAHPSIEGALQVYKQGYAVPRGNFGLFEEYGNYHKSKSISGADAVSRFYKKRQQIEDDKQKELHKIRFDNLGNPYRQ
jgi:hypothetical protein